MAIEAIIRAGSSYDLESQDEITRRLSREGQKRAAEGGDRVETQHCYVFNEGPTEGSREQPDGAFRAGTP